MKEIGNVKECTSFKVSTLERTCFGRRNKWCLSDVWDWNGFKENRKTTEGEQKTAATHIIMHKQVIVIGAISEWIAEEIISTIRCANIDDTHLCHVTTTRSHSPLSMLVDTISNPPPWVAEILVSTNLRNIARNENIPFGHSTCEGSVHDNAKLLDSHTPRPVFATCLLAN